MMLPGLTVRMPKKTKNAMPWTSLIVRVNVFISIITVHMFLHMHLKLKIIQSANPQLYV